MNVTTKEKVMYPMKKPTNKSIEKAEKILKSEKILQLPNSIEKAQHPHKAEMPKHVIQDWQEAKTWNYLP